MLLLFSRCHSSWMALAVRYGRFTECNGLPNPSEMLQVPLMKGHLHISYFVQPAVEKPILHTNNHISEAENLLTDQLLALFISPLQHTHIYSPL